MRCIGVEALFRMSYSRFMIIIYGPVQVAKWPSVAKSWLISLINRPGVAGAVLKHLCYWLIQSVSQCSCSSKSSKYHKSQTIRAREPTFWENVHPPHHVTCYISHVTCYMSCVMCPVSYIYIYFDKVMKLIGGGSVINGPTPSSFTSDAISYKRPCKIQKKGY